VTQVYLYEPVLGQTSQLLAAGVEAKAIHDRHGAYATVTVDQLGTMQFLLSFDDWAHFAKYQDSSNPEFEAFMEKVSKRPSGKLIFVSTQSVQ
jgi:hypothetical protein